MTMDGTAADSATPVAKSGRGWTRPSGAALGEVRRLAQEVEGMRQSQRQREFARSSMAQEIAALLEQQEGSDARVAGAFGTQLKVSADAQSTEADTPDGNRATSVGKLLGEDLNLASTFAVCASPASQLSISDMDRNSLWGSEPAQALQSPGSQCQDEFIEYDVAASLEEVLKRASCAVNQEETTALRCSQADELGSSTTNGIPQSASLEEDVAVAFHSVPQGTQVVHQDERSVTRTASNTCQTEPDVATNVQDLLRRATHFVEQEERRLSADDTECMAQFGYDALLSTAPQPMSGASSVPASSRVDLERAFVQHVSPRMSARSRGSMSCEVTYMSSARTDSLGGTFTADLVLRATATATTDTPPDDTWQSVSSPDALYADTPYVDTPQATLHASASSAAAGNADVFSPGQVSRGRAARDSALVPRLQAVSADAMPEPEPSDFKTELDLLRQQIAVLTRHTQRTEALRDMILKVLHSGPGGARPSASPRSSIQGHTPSPAGVGEVVPVMCATPIPSKCDGDKLGSQAQRLVENMKRKLQLQQQILQTQIEAPSKFEELTASFDKSEASSPAKSHKPRVPEPLPEPSPMSRPQNTRDDNLQGLKHSRTESPRSFGVCADSSAIRSKWQRSSAPSGQQLIRQLPMPRPAGTESRSNTSSLQPSAEDPLLVQASLAFADLVSSSGRRSSFPALQSTESSC